jgi:hypothetical protein
LAPAGRRERDDVATAVGGVAVARNETVGGLERVEQRYENALFPFRPMLG